MSIIAKCSFLRSFAREVEKPYYWNMQIRNKESAGIQGEFIFIQAKVAVLGFETFNHLVKNTSGARKRQGYAF